MGQDQNTFPDMFQQYIRAPPRPLEGILFMVLTAKIKHDKAAFSWDQIPDGFKCDPTLESFKSGLEIHLKTDGMNSISVLLHLFLSNLLFSCVPYDCFSCTLPFSMSYFSVLSVDLEKVLNWQCV